MNLKDKRFLVAGIGKSGIAAAELLIKQRMDVRLYDGNTNLDTEALVRQYPFLEDTEVILGVLPKKEMQKTDILVLSPGISTDLPMVTAMRDMGIAVWGEIELAYAFAKGYLLAVTGTNGKTTTTTLLGEIELL